MRINSSDSCCHINFNQLSVLSLKKSVHVRTKVNAIAEKVFKTVQKTFSFPIRFMGAVSWSLPGVIVRLPIELFKMARGRQGSLLTALFGRYHHFSKRNINIEEARKYIPIASISSATYRSNFKWVEPFNYHAEDPRKLNLPLHKLTGAIEARTSCFFDPTTALKAIVVSDDKTVVVAFGPLNSCNTEVEGKKQKQLVNRQWRTIFTNFFGVKKRAFKQAAEITAAIKAHPKFKDKTIHVTGQSFGGGLAAYAALKTHTKGTVFNAVPLGAGQQAMIDADTLKNADKYLTQVCVKGDHVTDSKFLAVVGKIASVCGLRIPAHLGKSLRIPSAYNTIKGSHRYCFGSLMHFTGHNKFTHSWELPQTEIDQLTQK